MKPTRAINSAKAGSPAMTEGTCSAASRHLLLPRRHQESTKRRKKASEATIRENWAELGQKGPRGSEIEGSEMARSVLFAFFLFLFTFYGNGIEIFYFLYMVHGVCFIFLSIDL